MYRLYAIKSGCCREVAVAKVAFSGGSTVMIRPTKSLKCNNYNEMQRRSSQSKAQDYFFFNLSWLYFGPIQ